MSFDLSNKLIAAAALATLVAAPAVGKSFDDDDVIEREFIQRGFDGGGMVKVRFWGRDTDGDGQLYSMSGFLANFLPFLDPDSDGTPLPVGNEFLRVEMTFLDFFGLPCFEQVFDESETPIDQTPNFGPTAFYGFSYNLDGGKLGDDPVEGFSFAPLAPSIAYTQGELFEYLLGPGFPLLTTCGPDGDAVCASVLQFNMFAEVVNEAFTNRRVNVKKIKNKPIACSAD